MLDYIELPVDFWDSIPIRKLIRKLGLDGPVSLQRLGMWIAKNKEDGYLYDMDEEDIEIIANWPGTKGAFVSTLLEMGWLDKDEKGYLLFGWDEEEQEG